MKHYGLIGKKLDHSFSRSFFTKKFEREKIAAEYDNLELPNISAFSEILKQNNYSGFNVTIPYKELVIPFLDEVDNEAAEVGAVNTIKIVNGKSIGYNSDIFGFHQSIKPFLKSAHERALILGTGGAAKAVAYVLRKIGLDVQFVSRTPKEGAFSYSDINEHILRHYLLIINTTPLGTFPNILERPPIPYDFLGPEHLLYDLVYNPTETEFLREGRVRGAAIHNGLDMLHLQAERSWQIWNS